MRKLVSMAAVAVLCSTSALFAETSGAFLGLGVGYGNIKLQDKFDDHNDIGGGSYKQTEKANGVSYGFVVGYKQFFNDYLGLRYYANLDLTHGKFKSESPDGTKNSHNTTFINYGVNVDFLGNFVSNESLDFGGFIGLGIGGNTIKDKYLDDIKKAYEEAGITSKLKTTGFDIALNVGLRTNIATNHGVEVAFRVPFLPITVANKSAVDELGTDLGKFKATLGQDVRFLARYTYSF